MINALPWNPKNGIEAFQQADTHVIKLGGQKSTRIAENLENMLTPHRSGKNIVVVVSSFKSYEDGDKKFRHGSVEENKQGFDTNEHLICAARLLAKGNIKMALEILEAVAAFSKDVASRNIKSGNDDQKEAELLSRHIGLVIDARIDALKGVLNAYHSSKDSKKRVHVFNEEHILEFEGKRISVRGFGDELARDVYTEYFRMKCYSPKIMTFKEATERIFKEPDLEALHRNVASSLSKVATGIRQELKRVLTRIGDTQTSGILIADGYLPVLGSQKGCADKVSAALAIAAHNLGHKAIVVIEQDTPMQSIDPSIVEASDMNPRTVQKMSYPFATEAFAYQSRTYPDTYHPEALLMLEHKGIDTVVLNPKDVHKDRITHITKRCGKKARTKGIEMMGCIKTPTRLVISSGKAVNTHGYEACLAKWFADNGISIDQIITSACSVTYVFAEKLPERRAHDLEKYINSIPELGDALVKREADPTVSIFLMGNNIHRRGDLEVVCRTLKDARAEISYMAQGVSRTTMILGIDERHEQEVLKALHTRLIEKRKTSHEIQRLDELFTELPEDKRVELLQQAKKLAKKRPAKKTRTSTPPAKRKSTLPPPPKVPTIKDPGIEEE